MLPFCTRLGKFFQISMLLCILVNFWHPLGPFCLHFVPFWLPLGTFWLLFGAIWFTFAHSRGLFSHFGISPRNFLYFIILPTQVLQTSRIFVQVVHSAVAGLRLCRAKDNNSTTKNLQGPPRTNTEQGTQTKIENSKHDTTFHIIPPTAKKRIPRNGTCTKRGAAVSRRMASSIKCQIAATALKIIKREKE